MSSSILNKQVYSDLKIFNYKEFIKNMLIGTNPPLHIRLKPTNMCNHKCNYCSYRNPKQTLGRDMVLTDSIPFPKMMATIEDIISMGVKAITFSGGGEPTVYPRFKEVIERLSVSPVKFALLTNGALFTGKIADIFSKFGSWVRISIDGWDRDSYKKFRGVDDFDKVINNINSFSSDTCYLGLNIVVTKDNAPHIYDIVKTIECSEVRTIKISPCIVNDDIKENIAYHKKLNKVVDLQIRYIKKDFNIPINYTYHDQLCGFNKKYIWCPNTQMRPVIGADQNIYVCHDKAYEPMGLLASFKNKSFKEAWEGADKFKINPKLNCNHHCMADNKNKTVLDFLSIEHEEFI